MAIRQYIGARYVPKFYVNSVDGSTQWEANVVYEPLIFVTLTNGHMYISKKQVPATIGSPAENITYWLDIGSYNGFVEHLQDEIDGLDSEMQALTTKTGFIVNVKDYGAVGDGLTNDSQAIMDAINFVNANGGGTVFFPIGNYLTAPIVLSGSYKNITLLGVAPSKPWKTVSRLTFNSAGSVGIQCSDNLSEVATWSATAIKIKNLYIDCDNKVGVGINGNYDVTIEGCVIRHAVNDGVVLEGGSYPFTIRDTECSQNGRHGVYVKPAYTTVYNIINCELSNNNGYGLFIEGGNTCHIDNTVIQSNKMGGLKIYKVNPATLSHDLFLGNLMFTSVYFEDNGKLDALDPNYEGNHAVYIDAYTTPGFSGTGIPFILFENCKANASASGDAWSVKGVALFRAVNTSPDPNIDWTVNGFSYDNVGFDTGENYNASDYSFSSTNKYKERIIRNGPRKVLAKIGDGYIGKRGRMRELEYHLSDITAGSTVRMDVLNSSSFMKGYGMINDATLYDMLIVLRKSISSGTLTFRLFYGYTIYGSKEANFGSEVVMDSTNNKALVINYNLLQHFISRSWFVGIEIEASNDFAFSNGVADNNDIVAELFVET